MKKKSYNILKSLIAFGVLLITFACSDDDTEPQVVTVGFEAATLEIAENNGDFIPVELNLSGQSPSAGEIKITVTNSAETTYGTHYTTNPDGTSGVITIAVPANTGTVSFAFTPIDNTNDEDNRSVTFTISSVSDNFQLSEQNSIEVIIVDDELFQPVSIAFASETGELSEFATDPFEVSFSLGAVAEGPGTFIISIEELSGATSNDYVTDPPASAGKITGTVNTGDATASINISAIDNQIDATNKKLLLTLVDATGGLLLADEGLSFELTIIDDDESGPIEIQATQAAFTRTVGGTGTSYFEPREMAQNILEIVEETDLGNGVTGYGDAYFRFDLSDFVINPDNISNAVFIFNFPLWDPFRNGGELNPSVRFEHDIYAFEYENDWDETTDTARVALNIISSDTISQSPNKKIATEKYTAKDDVNAIRAEYEKDRILNITDFIKNKLQSGETVFTIGLRKIEDVLDDKSRTFKIAGPTYKNENDESVLRPKLRIE